MHLLANDFIDNQIKTGSSCTSDDSCSASIANSVCHPFGFCYCPSGTVKTEVRSPATGENEVQCLAGKGTYISTTYL